MSMCYGMAESLHIDGLVQERRNSIANALELRLSCTNPSIYGIKIWNVITYPCPNLRGIVSLQRPHDYIWAVTLLLYPFFTRCNFFHNHLFTQCRL